MSAMHGAAGASTAAVAVADDAGPEEQTAGLAGGVLAAALLAPLDRARLVAALLVAREQVGEQG